MRRTVLGLLAASLMLIASAAPVVAAKPIHIPPSGGPGAPLVFAAGELCEFPLRIELLTDQTKLSIWEYDDGSMRILSRGYVDQVAINTRDGTSISQRGGYMIDLAIHADGSVEVRASGNLFAWYYPGDAVVGLAPGAFFVRGHGTESYDAAGALVAARFYGGSVIALCDALAVPD